MSKKNKSEVLIIGAGPSGLLAAKVFSDNGIKASIIEKDAKNKKKSFYSSIINIQFYEEIFGGFIKNQTLAIEREITDYRAYFLKEGSFSCISNQNNNHLCIKRELFNKALTDILESKGIQIFYETIGRELILENGKIKGIKTDDSEHYADVIIICEGANSILSKQAGLKSGELSPEETFLFVEETIEIPSEAIEERFNLQNNKGLTAKIFTHSFIEIPGINYMHTNKSSVTISSGILLSDSIKNSININDYHEKIKTHPGISPFISNGTTKTYSSYIMPAPLKYSKRANKVKLYSDNCLVAGGAAMFVNHFKWDISLLAAISGKIAAETVIEARGKNDYSEKSLSMYESKLRENKEYNDFINDNRVHAEGVLPFQKSPNELGILFYNDFEDKNDRKVLENLSNIALTVN